MSVGAYFAQRTAYTPLRLTPDERAELRVLEGALSVSEYTDKVDVLSSFRSNRAQRIQQQLADVFAVLLGLTVSATPKAAQLVQERDFEDNADFFASVFEVGRRHKISALRAEIRSHRSRVPPPAAP